MEGVLFDLDGVITDTAKFHFSAWRVLAREKIGVELPADFEADLKGVSRLESLQRIIHFAGKTGVYSEAQIQAFATEPILGGKYAVLNNKSLIFNTEGIWLNT